MSSLEYYGLNYKVIVYNNTKEDGEKRKKFWSDLDRVLDRLENGYSCM